jgi:hypothetical protein
MATQADVQRATAATGLIAVVSGHLLWASGIYPPDNQPHIFPGLLAVATLLVSSLLRKVWEATGVSKLQALALFGLGAAAFNAYFIRHPPVGAMLATAASMMALAALMRKRRAGLQ